MLCHRFVLRVMVLYAVVTGMCVVGHRGGILAKSGMCTGYIYFQWFVSMNINQGRFMLGL